MRPSARHMLLVSTLIPAFLLIGCDAPTGPGEPLEATEPDVQEPGEAPDQSVNTDGCFRFNGEEYCPSAGSQLKRQFKDKV